MQSDPQLQARYGRCFDDRLCASDCPRLAVERDNESVACRVHLAPAESTQLVAYGLIVLVQSRTPSLVPEGSGSFRGPDDVGEQDGRQNAVNLEDGTLASDELRNLVDERVHRRGEADVPTGQLDEAGAVDVVSEEAAVLDRNERVLACMEHKGGRLDERQGLACITPQCH